MPNVIFHPWACGLEGGMRWDVSAVAVAAAAVVVLGLGDSARTLLRTGSTPYLMNSVITFRIHFTYNEFS